MNKINKKLQFLLLCISVCYIKFSCAASIAELDSSDDTPNSIVATTEKDKTKKDSQNKFINVIMKQHIETTAISEGDNIRLIYQDEFPDKKDMTGILWLYAKLNNKNHALAGVSYPENKVYIYNYPDITCGNAFDCNAYPVDNKVFFANSTVLELKNVTQDSLGKFIHNIRVEGSLDTETFAELTLLNHEVTTNSYSIPHSTTNNRLYINLYNNNKFARGVVMAALTAGGIIALIALGCTVHKYIKSCYYRFSKTTVNNQNSIDEERKLSHKTFNLQQNTN